MVEDRIETRFQNYLRSYHACLNSISDLLTSELYQRVTESREKGLLKGLVFLSINDDFVRKMREKDTGDLDKAKKNLLNSWYHECALRYPFEENTSHLRMKFASWKIIQFYYAIFTGLSAINRTFYRKRWNHDTALDLFLERILITKELNPSFFVPPFSFVLNEDEIQPSFEETVSWDYGRTFHCPRIEKSLNEIYQKIRKPTSIFHFFKSFREWATYQDSYIFINLYGAGPKSELERYLNDISFCFNYLVESYMIEFFGMDDIKDLYIDFTRRMNNHLQVTPLQLVSRFECHEKYSL